MKSKLVLAMLAAFLAGSFGIATADDATPTHNHMAEKGGAVASKAASASVKKTAAAKTSRKAKTAEVKTDKHNHQSEKGGYAGAPESMPTK
jgi:hypothetical protein